MRAIFLIVSSALLIALGVETAHAQSGSAPPDSISGTSTAPVDTPSGTSVASTDSIALADSTGVPQRDIFDVLSHDILHRPRKAKTERTAGLHWALLPTFSYNTVYGFAFGAMVAGA